MLSLWTCILSIPSPPVTMQRIHMGDDLAEAYAQLRRDVDEGTALTVSYPRTLFRDGNRLWYAYGTNMYYLDLNTNLVTSVAHTLMSMANAVVKSGSTFYMCGYDAVSVNHELRPFTFDYDTATVVSGTTVTVTAKTNDADVSQCSVDAAGNVVFYRNGGGLWVYRVAEGVLHDLSAGDFRNGGDVVAHPYGDRVLQNEVYGDWMYSKSLSYDGSAYATPSVLGKVEFDIAARGLDVSDDGRLAITTRQYTSLAFVVDVHTLSGGASYTGTNTDTAILTTVDVCPGIGCIDSSISESDCVGTYHARTWSATLGGCKVHGFHNGYNAWQQSQCTTENGLTWVDTGTNRGPCSSTAANFEPQAFHLDADHEQFWVVNGNTLWHVSDVGSLASVAPPAPPPSAAALQDPHVVYPNGARTDVRGFDGAYLNYVSFPGLSVNVKTENATFRLGNATIHGSFLTELHVSTVADAAKKKTFEMSHVAARANDHQWGWDMVRSSCGGHVYHISPHGHRTCEGVHVDVDVASSTFVGHGWSVTTTVMPVYGRLDGCRHRLDVRVQYDGRRASAAHGILGQGFAKGDAQTDGRVDVYPEAGTYTTVAQGEGALDGTVHDYVVAHPYAAAFGTGGPDGDVVTLVARSA